MRTFIKMLMKLLMLCLLGAGVYFAYTEYYKDENVLERKTEALLDCFEKDSTETYGSAISTAELSHLLDDDLYFKVDTENFPFAEFIKKDANKTKIIAFHETLPGTQYTTVLENRTMNVAKILPANDGTVEGEEKAPARAKVEVSFKLRKEAGKSGNIHSNIKADLRFIKRGRTWKVEYVLFKHADTRY